MNFTSKYFKKGYEIRNVGQFRETKLPEVGNSYIDDDNHWELIRVDEILFDDKKVRMAIVDNHSKKIYIFYLTHGLINSNSYAILKEIENNIFEILKVQGITYENILESIITIGDISFKVDIIIENERTDILGIIDTQRKELRYVRLT